MAETETENVPHSPPLVGVVVICHGRLAQELIHATEFIVGRLEAVEAIATGEEYDIDKLHGQIKEAIDRVDRGGGVLILTDMFGGTPSNLGLAFLEENRIEILTGVNLPMMVKLAQNRPKVDGLRPFAELLKGHGQRNIVLASDILNPRQQAAGAGGKG